MLVLIQAMYVERDITPAFRRVAGHYSMVALVGPRQAGKTTFLKEMMKGCRASYVLFDDPDARGLFNEDVKKFRLQYLEGYDLGVLDEVQYCRDAGSKLKYLVDTGSRLWVTSSSEILLRKEVLSYLVGRVSIVRLYPFSLAEFLRARGQRAYTAEILRRHLWEHMTHGGYPRVVLTGDPEMRRTILRDLYETMLLKDVARTFSIEDLDTLERLVRYLAFNVGALLSYENACKLLDVSYQTLKKYTDALVKSYLIALVKPFFTNKTREITKQPKVYFLDTGLRNAIANEYPVEPTGPLFENYVFSELIKMGFTPKYWRTKSKAEVDFVVEVGNEVVPIEVKIMANPPKVERSMRSFIERYRPHRAFVVFYRGEKGEVEVGGTRLVYTDVAGLRDAVASFI
jgi:hypothetical protein